MFFSNLQAPPNCWTLVGLQRADLQWLRASLWRKPNLLSNLREIREPICQEFTYKRRTWFETNSRCISLAACNLFPVSLTWPARKAHLNWHVCVYMFQTTSMVRPGGTLHKSNPDAFFLEPIGCLKAPCLGGCFGGSHFVGFPLYFVRPESPALQLSPCLARQLRQGRISCRGGGEKATGCDRGWAVQMRSRIQWGVWIRGQPSILNSPVARDRSPG